MRGRYRAMLPTFKEKGKAMRKIADRKGIYRIGAVEKLLHKRVHVLKNVCPSATELKEQVDLALVEEPVYGVVKTGLPLPATGGSYLVEVLDDAFVRIEAYLDPYGRAFAVSDVCEFPPAFYPSVSLARYEEQPQANTEQGLVYAYKPGGRKVEVARYCCKNDRYSLFDTWYNFANDAVNAPYDSVLGRIYLAFVLHPRLADLEVPARGFDWIVERIKSETPLKTLRALLFDIKNVQQDSALKLPALASYFVQMLEDIGLEASNAEESTEEPLRLVKTADYAQTFYVMPDGERTDESMQAAFALEAALNRFLLLKNVLGDSAFCASEKDCLKWDQYLVDVPMLSFPDLAHPTNAPQGEIAGEWEIRCILAAAIERLVLPVRIDVATAVDAAQGKVAFDIAVPDKNLMPLRDWRDDPSLPCGGEVFEKTSAQRDVQAVRYALSVGLALVEIAFSASVSIKEVGITINSLKRDESGTLLRGAGRMNTSFNRDQYLSCSQFEEMRKNSPESIYQAFDMRIDADSSPTFSFTGSLSSSVSRRAALESKEAVLTDDAYSILGAKESRNLSVDHDAFYRLVAEELADNLVKVQGASEAVRIVRATQESERVSQDERAISSCTRLMAALAEGKIDMSDQNAVVSCFLGEDRCLAALRQVRALDDRSWSEAVSLLTGVIAEADALDGFVDGPSTVYRSFDSYVARILYNRACLLECGFPEAACLDAGKQVVLVPDSYYLCHLEVVRLLENSFDRMEEALRYGRRAVQMAPATAAGYRQLGRAYMLMGDMENAAQVLQDGLRIAVQPTDVAMLYYQLGYVLWKAGQPHVGAACYVKSIDVFPVAFVQATAEMNELISEVPSASLKRNQADERLREAGVPIAPDPDILDLLIRGAVIAADAELLPVACNLLAIYLRYRPDDALGRVLRSFESTLP